MTNQLPPPTKENLILKIIHSHEQLKALMASCSDKELATIADPAGWTLKDHLGHLAVWEMGIAALLRRQPRYQAMGLDESTLTSGDFDAINAVIHARIRLMSAEEVRQMSGEAQKAILQALAPLSDADLMRPYNDYQEKKVAEGETRPVFGLIAGNTFGHYAEHLEVMQKAIDQVTAREL